MNMVEIINKKRRKEELTEKEIQFVIEEYMKKTIPDYQMSAFLMAVVLNDMTDSETIYFTKYMLESGKQLDLSIIDGIKVDKHSTGGVGDKTTLIIAPIVSSCGVVVPKMSGRGLGHTGGTIDKLESIPGFKVKLTEKQFINELNKIKMAIVSQTEDMALADKKIYALRDVTGTVESIPLIASSIMSKKLALGSDKIVIDLKVGKGALVKDIDSARRLAKLMIKIGNIYDKEVVCVLTNMDVPLGYKIGNALEIEEVIDILQNKSSSNLKELCVFLSSMMVSLGKNIPLEQAKEMVIDSLETGKAYQQFLRFVSYQKGDLSSLKKATYQYQVKATMNGFISDIDSFQLALIAGKLGSGRKNKEDEIDYEAGIVLHKQIHDYVSTKEVIATLYSNKEINISDREVLSSFEISSKKKEYPLIYEVIR